MSDPGPRDPDELDLDLDLQLDLEPPATPPAAAPAAPFFPAATKPPTPTIPSAPATPELSEMPAAPAMPAAASLPTSSVVAEPLPSAAAQPAAQAGARDADDAALVGGQWVWQYGAPPPPPSFSAVFFSGQALTELYRFFACGLLVFVGCLLPWGKSVQWVVQHGEPTLGYSAPPAGYEVPIGALSLAIALWLMLVSCYGIYTGRQKVLPVFLMLVPAWVSWSRTLAAWAQIGALPQKLGPRETIEQLFDVAGTGVLLTLIGSSIIALSLLVVIVKVFKKQPGEADADAARSPRKSKTAEKDAAPREAEATLAPAPPERASPATATAGKADARKDRRGDEAGGKGEGGRRGRRR